MNATRLLRAWTAALVVGAAAMVGVGPAHAAPSASAPTRSAAVIYDCIWTADHGIYLFRTKYSTTADYFVGRGTRMTSLGCVGPETGRSYSDCGGGNRWVRIHGTKHGWAALSCITFVKRVVRA